MSDFTPEMGAILLVNEALREVEGGGHENLHQHTDTTFCPFVHCRSNKQRWITAMVPSEAKTSLEQAIENDGEFAGSVSFNRLNLPQCGFHIFTLTHYTFW